MILIFIIVLSSAYEPKIFNYNPYPFLSILGFVIASAGFVLVIASVFSFRQRITPHPVPLHNYKLRKTGMYAIVRHPIYFSILVIMTGSVFFFQAYISLVFVIALFLLFRSKAAFEERFLVEKFSEYAEYQTKTRKLIPFIY
jgi:protein-S-isoprenylcysteine O-methyltransferase Ste14